MSVTGWGQVVEMSNFYDSSVFWGRGGYGVAALWSLLTHPLCFILYILSSVLIGLQDQCVYFSEVEDCSLK